MQLAREHSHFLLPHRLEPRFHVLIVVWFCMLMCLLWFLVTCELSLLKQAVTHFSGFAVRACSYCQYVGMNLAGVQTTMSSNTLGNLPLEALDMVLCLLDPPALLHLHAATGAGIEAVAERVTTMKAVHRCAHHWLHLSQRLLHHIGKTVRLCRPWDPPTKHELIEELRFQISHINDVAAFLYHWVPCQYLDWGYQLHYPDDVGPDIEFEGGERLDRLNNKMREALSLGYPGYLYFSNGRKDPKNKFKQFSHVPFHLEFRLQLLFLCTLHRLQQLNPEAVLARLHSTFSRCCRFDLTLAWRVLCLDRTNSVTQAEHQASKQEAPAVEMFAAFAQNEPHIRETVSQLTAMQREEMICCVQTMVNNHLVHIQADTIYH